MRDLLFRCPNCDASLAFDHKLAGRTLACPSCRGQLAVPVPDASFACPSCNIELHVTSDAVGEFECPACKGAIVIGDEPAAEETPQLRAKDPQETRQGSRCQGCGANLPGGAVICVGCGLDLRTGMTVPHFVEPAARHVAIEKPSSVGVAVALCWASWGLTALGSLFAARPLMGMLPGGVIIALAAILLGLYGGWTWLVCAKTNAGRSWPRVVLLVLAILGAPFAVLHLFRDVASNPFGTVFDVLGYAASCAVVALLFTRSASEWLGANRRDSDRSTGAVVAITLLLLLVPMFIVGIFAAILVPSVTKARQVAQQKACANNLLLIDTAKEEWAYEKSKANGAGVGERDVAPYLPGKTMPACPAVGSYTLNPVGVMPECSVHGTIDEHGNPIPASPAGASEVVARPPNAAAGGDGPGPAGIQELLHWAILPEFDFRQANLGDIVDFLNTEFKEAVGPNGKVVTFAMGPPKGAPGSKAAVVPTVTMSGRNMPFDRVLDLVAEAAGYACKAVGSTIILSPDAQPMDGRDAHADGSGADTAAMRRVLASVIVPEVDFRQANIDDIVQFLIQTLDDLGAKDKTVNFVLIPRTTAGSPVSTDSLTVRASQMPLDQVLDVVVDGFGCKWSAEGNTVVIRPSGTQESVAVKARVQDEEDLPKLTADEVVSVLSSYRRCSRLIMANHFEAAATDLVATTRPPRTQIGQQAFGILTNRLALLVDLKAFVVRRLSAEPLKSGWHGAADVLGADDDTIRLAARKVPWDQVDVEQMLKFMQYAFRSPPSSKKDHAHLTLAAAAYCVEHGRVTDATLYADRAVELDESLKNLARLTLLDPSQPANVFLRDWLMTDEETGVAAAARGQAYWAGERNLSKDSAAAAKWLRKAAEQGDAVSQGKLGFMYKNGDGVPKDYAEAARWYRKSAEQGVAPAQVDLGCMCRDGDGVAKDEAEAVRLFRKAAEQGFAPGQVNLGWMYANGCGVPKDPAEAVKWFDLAAQQGERTAQLYLGLGYKDGDGVKRNSATAAKWLLAAAEAGDADAQQEIGWMYFNGEGVPNDLTKAVGWLRKAAEQENDLAQLRLGYMYGYGKGVPVDREEAVKWWNKSAKNGNETAQGILADLEK